MATSLTGPPQEIVESGSLHVEGSIGPAWRVRAGFDLTVGGQVERAELEAGSGCLRLEAPCRQSELRAGHLRDLCGRLLAALGDADRDLTALTDSAEALQHAAARRGQRVPLAAAVGALTSARWPDLAERLAAGAYLVTRERLRHPTVPETLLSALETARDALADASDLGFLRSRARVLGGELATVRAAQGAPPRSIVESLTECNGDFAGALAVRGSGVHACELAVGGDLVLGGRSGSLGGHVRVHGKVVTPRIRGGTRLELLGGEGGLRLRAETVAAGVEVTVAGQRIPSTGRRGEWSSGWSTPARSSRRHDLSSRESAAQAGGGPSRSRAFLISRS
jgi:hypothetical protein